MLSDSIIYVGIVDTRSYQQYPERIRVKIPILERLRLTYYK